jgi:DNA-directed RNA polymerase specialized sigma24 family protein
MAGESLLVSALNACRARLKAFIRGRSTVRDDADDIVQEVTYQLMNVEQPVENVAAWLFRAARNEMTDRARKKRELPLSGYFTADDDGISLKMRLQKHSLACRTRRKRST